jgi:hypothetical protein
MFMFKLVQSMCPYMLVDLINNCESPMFVG